MKSLYIRSENINSNTWPNTLTWKNLMKTFKELHSEWQCVVSCYYIRSVVILEKKKIWTSNCTKICRKVGDAAGCPAYLWDFIVYIRYFWEEELLFASTKRAGIVKIALINYVAGWDNWDQGAILWTVAELQSTECGCKGLCFYDS